MNPGQKKFYTFMLERTEEKYKNEMKELLEDAFEKAASNQQTPEFFAEFNKMVFTYLKPEAIPEVKQAMALFQSPGSK